MQAGEPLEGQAKLGPERGERGHQPVDIGAGVLRRPITALCYLASRPEVVVRGRPAVDTRSKSRAARPGPLDMWQLLSSRCSVAATFLSKITCAHFLPHRASLSR
jgi:hypothetical protein